MVRYTRSPRAADDLVEIWNYIAKDNPVAADRLLDRIDQLCQTLMEYPYMGRERPDIMVGIHSFAVNKYVIYYRHIEVGIEVIRVLHAARDVHSEF